MASKNLLVVLLLGFTLLLSGCYAETVTQPLPIESNGGVAVNIQDQTSPLIDLYLSQKIADINITVNTSLDDKTVSIESGVAPLVGNLVCFKEGTAFYQGFIISVVSLGGDDYNITLDSPLDYAYTTAGGCSIREHDLATADGSVNTQIFSLSPFNLDNGTRWDIVRLMFYIESSSAMDDGLFGDQTALTNGLVIRRKNGFFQNLFNIKSNGEFAQRAYDRQYAQAAKPPSGTAYSLITRRTFGGQNKNGVVIRLNANDSDSLQALVQDDLTALDHVHIIAQGHLVQD